MKKATAASTGKRPPRRPEENHPSNHYIGKLHLLGPRKGELQLTFECRLAYIAEGRKIIRDLWVGHKGNLHLVATDIGLRTFSGIYNVLGNYGLSIEVLTQLTGVGRQITVMDATTRQELPDGNS